MLLGCLLPDVPWIGLRIFELTTAGAHVYDARVYAVAQSCLLGTWVLAGALAALAPRSGRVFAILASGALAHLLLDALETKLGNGVVLFAPFSWQLINLGWFWTESAISVLLTGAGALWIAWVASRSPCWPALCFAPRRMLAAGLLAAAYLLLPLAWMDSVEAADLHFVRTLRQRSERAGRPLELDRNAFVPDPSGGAILAWNGERLPVEGIQEASPRTVSVRARFRDPLRLEVQEVHVHWPAFRDAASYVGLCALVVYWMRGWFARVRG